MPHLYRQCCIALGGSLLVMSLDCAPKRSVQQGAASATSRLMTAQELTAIPTPRRRTASSGDSRSRRLRTGRPPRKPVTLFGSLSFQALDTSRSRARAHRRGRKSRRPSGRFCRDGYHNAGSSQRLRPAPRRKNRDGNAVPHSAVPMNSRWAARADHPHHWQTLIGRLPRDFRHSVIAAPVIS
jgi:hypothetical protein